MPTVVKKIAAEVLKGAQNSQKVIAESVANEIIFGIVGHVGSGTTTVAETLKNILEFKGLRQAQIPGRNHQGAHCHRGKYETVGASH